MGGRDLAGLVGNFLYGRMGYTMALGAVMVLSGSAVIWVTQKLWK